MKEFFTKSSDLNNENNGGTKGGFYNDISDKDLITDKYEKENQHGGNISNYKKKYEKYRKKYLNMKLQNQQGGSNEEKININNNKDKDNDKYHNIINYNYSKKQDVDKDKDKDKDIVLDEDGDVVMDLV